MNFEVLEEGESHAIIESEGEKYLIEDNGYDSDQDVFRFEVMNNDVVYTTDNVESKDGRYPIPDQVEVSSTEAEQIDTYLEAVEKVAQKTSMIDGVSEKKELFVGNPLEEGDEADPRDSLESLDRYGGE